MQKVKADSQIESKDYTEVIIEIGKVARKSTFRMMREFEIIISDSRLSGTEQKTVMVNNKKNSFLGSFKYIQNQSSEVLKLLEGFMSQSIKLENPKNEICKKSDGQIWNKSDTDWKDVPAGLRNGYTVNDLYQDILITNQ